MGNAILSRRRSILTLEHSVEVTEVFDTAVCRYVLNRSIAPREHQRRVLHADPVDVRGGGHAQMLTRHTTNMLMAATGRLNESGRPLPKNLWPLRCVARRNQPRRDGFVGRDRQLNDPRKQCQQIAFAARKI